jgi:hypothetical protein
MATSPDGLWASACPRIRANFRNHARRERGGRTDPESGRRAPTPSREPTRRREIIGRPASGRVRPRTGH